MKKELKFYSLLLVLILTLAFMDSSLFGTVENPQTRILAINSFEHLNVDIPCNVYISEGDDQKIVVEGPARFLKMVESEWKEGVLTIRNKAPNRLARWLGTNEDLNEKISIYIQLTDPHQLQSSNNANIISSERVLRQQSSTFHAAALPDNIVHLLRVVITHFVARQFA